MEPDKPAPGAQREARGDLTGDAGPAGRRGDRRPPDSSVRPRGRGGNPTVFPNTFNQRDEMVGNGEALTFRSRFNYHGFRYVRVIGLDTAPDASDATGYLIRTAYDRAGEFTSSNELLNQIYQMVTRTYEALTLGGYVVDCPTRERLGYGGDAGTSMETGMFNFSTGGLYNRWLSQLARCAGPGNRFASAHRAELSEPGRRRSDVGRNGGDAALADVPAIWRQAACSKPTIR